MPKNAIWVRILGDVNQPHSWIAYQGCKKSHASLHFRFELQIEADSYEILFLLFLIAGFVIVFQFLANSSDSLGFYEKIKVYVSHTFISNHSWFDVLSVPSAEEKYAAGALGSTLYLLQYGIQYLAN